MSESSTCNRCGQSFPFTTEFFPGHTVKGVYYLRHTCRSCWRARDRQYRNDHPEINRNAQKRWHKNNAEYLSDYMVGYKKRNPDKIRAINKRYATKYPDRVRATAARKKAKRRSLPATFTATDWQRALDYFHGVCAYCGNPPSMFDNPPVLHQEHHVPANKGGGYTPDNIIPACQSCNLSKHDKDALSWLTSRFGKAQALIIMSRIQAYFDSLTTDA